MKKALVVMALLSSATYATYRWIGSDDRSAKDTADAELTQDRLWIDHMPRNERDMIQLFAVLTEEPVGIFHLGSQWKQTTELFFYEGHRGELRIHYPQTGEKETVKAVARECHERDMDYCLELSGNSRGVKKYYSRKGWEIGGGMTKQQLEQRVEQLRQQL